MREYQTPDPASPSWKFAPRSCRGEESHSKSPLYSGNIDIQPIMQAANTTWHLYSQAGQNLGNLGVGQIRYENTLDVIILLSLHFSCQCIMNSSDSVK